MKIACLSYLLLLEGLVVSVPIKIPIIIITATTIITINAISVSTLQSQVHGKSTLCILTLINMNAPLVLPHALYKSFRS